MANNDINELRGLLTDFMREIKRTVPKGNSKEGKYAEGNKRSFDKTTDGVVREFENLRREIRVNIEEQKAQKQAHRSLKEQFIDTFKGIDRFKTDIDRVGAEMRRATRYSSDEYRKISQTTFDAFKGIITSGKNFSEELNKMSNSQSDFMRFVENIGNGSKAIEDKIKSLYSKKDIAESDIHDLKKSQPKATPSDRAKIDKELEEKRQYLAGVNAEIKKEEIARAEYVKGLDAVQGQFQAALGNVKELNKLGIDVLQNIDQEKLKDNAFFKQSSEEQLKIAEQLRKNAKAVATGATAAYDSVNYATKASKARFDQVTAKALEDTYKIGGPQFLRDFTSRQKYSIESSTGTGLIAQGTGMSQDQTNELIGQNRLLFRTLGHGNSAAPFQVGGGFGDLQRQQAVFGKFGKEAADQVVAFGNTLMTSGFSPDNITAMTDDFKKLSKSTGMTSEGLVDLYKNMVDTGQMSMLQQQLSDKPEKDRLNLIDEEIKKRLDYNRQLGYSIDYIKKQNELALAQKYADTNTRIRSQIGVQMAASILNSKLTQNGGAPLNSSLAQIDDAQQAALIATGDPDKIKRATDAQAERQRVSAALAESRNDINLQMANSPNGAFATIGQSVMLDQLSDLNHNLFGSDAEQALQAKTARRGQNEGSLGPDVGKQLKNVIIGKSDSITATMDALGGSFLKLKTYVDSITGNPLGAAGGGLANFVGRGFEDVMINRLLNGGAGAAAGAVGAGGITGALGSLSAALLSPAGLIAAAGLAAIALHEVKSAARSTAEVQADNKLDRLKDMTSGLRGDNSLIGKIKKGTNYAGDVAQDALDAMNPLIFLQDIYDKKAKRDTVAGLTEEQLAAQESQYDALKDMGAADILTGRFASTPLAKAYGVNNFNPKIKDDRQLEQLMFSGVLDADTLKKYGAPDEYIKALQDDMQKPEVVEVLKDIRDGVDKTNKLKKEEMTKNDYDELSADAQTKRISDFIGSQQKLAAASGNVIATFNSRSK